MTVTAPARARRTAQPSLGVDWHLPNPSGTGFRRRRFATTTPASSALIVLLADEGMTWSEVVEAILYDPEARAVARAFVEAGYGDQPASRFVR